MGAGLWRYSRHWKKRRRLRPRENAKAIKLQSATKASCSSLPMPFISNPKNPERSKSGQNNKERERGDKGEAYWTHAVLPIVLPSHVSQISCKNDKRSCRIAILTVRSGQSVSRKWSIELHR